MDRDQALSQAIVDTLREPLLVLDEDLRVVVASRSFYLKFQTESRFTQGCLLGELGEGQWDIPALRALLERIAPDNSVVQDFEVEIDFPELGRRVILMNARRVFYEGEHSINLLLAMEDVTERRLAERERDELLSQKALLLEEVQHRVANSLAIIASILLMKARGVNSSETRAHLEDAHKRVLSVAIVQRHLQPSDQGSSIELSAYLGQLCSSLAGSMISDEFCSIRTQVAGARVTSSAALSIGLIVTELVINALKHAFPESRPGSAIVVAYEVNGTDWKLSISDNGSSAGAAAWPPASTGLGTIIVNALAQRLDARVEMTSDATGTTVSIAHSTFKSLPKAA